jgi:hypothetical protein
LNGQVRGSEGGRKRHDTGQRANRPAGLQDVVELVDGKIKRFDCYPEGSIILTQLGVLGDLGAALEH